MSGQLLKPERERERGKVLEMSRNINMWSGRVREVQEESATDTHTHTHTHILTHTKRCERYRCWRENKKLVLLPRNAT